MAVGDTARLIASLELQDKFSKPIGRAQLSLGRFESSLGRMGRGVGQVGAGLATLGTRAALAAGAGLAAVVTTAASMEEAFIGIQKTVDETAAVSFDDLRKQLRGMSSDTGTAFEELSRIGEIGGALGIGIESLDEFIDVVNRLSVSTDLTAEAASTALGQLGTILHLEGEELRTFSDSLVALGNAGASTEPQIVDIAARFAAAGNAAGLSVQEILALASATASMGIEAEAGGTALSRVFNNVTTNIGLGNKKAKAFAASLGLSAAEFKQAWDRDALGTLQDFLAELNKLDKFEAAALLKAIGITNVRDISTVRLMAQNFGFLGEQLDVAANAQGALNEESDKFFGTSAAQFRRLRENVRLTADTIGVELLPITNELITEFVDFIQLDTSQASIKGFAKDLASSIRGFVHELKTADFSGFINTMKIVGEVGKKVVDIFLSLPPGIQAAIVTGAAINKLSGGLLGAGAGNIVGGAGSLFFDRFLGRGSSPANPMWVQSVGGPGGLVAGGGGRASWIGNALKVTVIGAVAVEGFNLAAEIAGINDPRHRDERGRPARTTNDLSERISAAEAAVVILRERAATGDTFAAKQLTVQEALLAELKLQTAALPSPLNPGGTRKPISGRGKAGQFALPNTAFDPGGGVVTLPDTALSPLKGPLATVATNTGRLPAILSRQERGMQVIAQRINESRGAVDRGLTALGGVVRESKSNLRVTVNVTSQLSISDTLRRITSARVATGTISEF